MSDTKVIRQPYDSVDPRERTAVLENLFVDSKPRLLRMAINMLNDATLAEDAVSEIWLRVLTHLPTFRQDAKITTWIYRIAMNTIVDMTRSKNYVVTHLPPNQTLSSAHTLLTNLQGQYQ